MSGIYGDMLLAWPEQYTSLTVFDMTPGINGGLSAVDGSELAIKGVFQNTRSGASKDSNGNLVETNGMELWTSTGGLSNKYLSWEGKLYRLIDNNNWSREGGFYRYGLEKVVGNATESDNASWNLGSGSFG